MSITTKYDDMRMDLKDDLNNCLDKAREMLDNNIWGYEDMKEGYALDIYIAIKNVMDSI
ncbi:MAG: hypothetical protein ACRCVJ_18730 [Clostridium sp.]|uniref:hypothetical protein n=1 Tax=Clostridium sp. TaxID=1506 RepID=UPI003F391452